MCVCIIQIVIPNGIVTVRLILSCTNCGVYDISLITKHRVCVLHTNSSVRCVSWFHPSSAQGSAVDTFLPQGLAEPCLGCTPCWVLGSGDSWSSPALRNPQSDSNLPGETEGDGQDKPVTLGHTHTALPGSPAPPSQG